MNIPKDAVLLIPEPEGAGESPSFGIKPGYYNRTELLGLLETHKSDGSAISFIADMLETGEPEADGFAQLLRANCGNAKALTRIIKSAKAA